MAASVGEREAIVWRERRITYSNLLERASRLASFLGDRGLGVRRERKDLAPWESGQDAVGLYLYNCPEYLEASLGGYAARTAPFNVNFRYVTEELGYLLSDADTAALIYHGRFAPSVAAVVPRLRRFPLLLQVADESGHELVPGAVDYETALSGAPSRVPQLDYSPDDLYLLYTGGTTGMPKGTMWRQADIWVAALGAESFGSDADTETIAVAAHRSPERTTLPNAPLMHGAAHWQALRSLLAGNRVVINSVVDRLDPIDVWTLIEREHVNRTLFIGDAFARPLMAELQEGQYDVSSLRVVALGGATTSPAMKQRLLAQLPGVVVVDLAGSSETGSALSHVSVAGEIVEAGVFAKSPDTAVLDPNLTRRLEPGDGVIGWLAKRGRIPLGYLNDRSRTESTFPTVEGIRWSVPGDRARLRFDGTVELVGRDSVTINSAGEKIFAEEVERALLSHEDVEDVIVVGRPSERWGQEVVAIVQVTTTGESSDAQILACAAGTLARFKLPKAIVRVPTVKRSAAGKADYGWARQLAENSEREPGPPL